MSRSYPPDSGPYSSMCSATAGGGGDGLHPVLQHLLCKAPDRAEVLALVGDTLQLAEETALQQVGADMFAMFVRNLPSSYRQRATLLEAAFRTMLDHALSLVFQARFMPGLVAEGSHNASVMAYVATQHVIGARGVAMDLYNSR